MAYFKVLLNFFLENKKNLQLGTTIQAFKLWDMYTATFARDLGGIKIIVLSFIKLSYIV